MKHFALLAAAYLAFALQAALSHRLALGDAAPVFLPLVLATVLLYLKGPAAIAWAAVIGLLSDCLASGPLGIDMLLFVLTALAARLAFNPKRRPGVPAVGLTSFAACLLTLLPSALIRELPVGGSVGIGRLLTSVPLVSAYSSVIAMAAALPCFSVVSALRRFRNSSFLQ